MNQVSDVNAGLSGPEQAVCRLIAGRRSLLLEDLQLHVGLPTGGGNRAALDETRERLTARASALGAVLELVAGDARPAWLYGENPAGGLESGVSGGASAGAALPTVVCRRERVGLGREVLIAGHLDTVHDPRGAFQRLTIDSSGKRAVGPGCVDMKGGLVIALAALEALEEAGEGRSWTLLLNSDEETGSYASRRVIERESGRVARAGGIGIALEPATSDGGLVVERAGSGQFVIEVRGKPAHVGRDFAAGVSAVAGLAKLIPRVLALTDLRSGVIVNIGPLDGGIATNVVPDRARAWGNVRFPTPEVGARIEDELGRIAAEAGQGEGLSENEGQGRVGQARVIVQTSFGRPAKPMTAGTGALAQVAVAAATALGQRLPFAKTAGVCDGNIMQSVGLATIDTLGVCGGGLHTLEEWIELDSLVERCQLLAVTMMRL